MQKKIILLLFIAIFSCSSSLLADEYNYQNILLGERAAGMGGAFIALSDSPAGSYYNPAGLAFAPANTISVAANAYSFSRGRIKDSLKIAGSSADLELDSFQSVPTTASYLWRFNLPGENQEFPLNAISFSVFIVDKTYYGGKIDLSSGDLSGSLHRFLDSQSLLIGPSFARKISEKFSLGISLFYLLRISEYTSFVQAETSTQYGEGFLKTNLFSGGLNFKLGGRYTFYPNYHLGLTFTLPTIFLHGSGDVYQSIIVGDLASAPSSRTVFDQTDLKAIYRLPYQIGLGLAFEQKKKYALAADVKFNGQQDYSLYQDYDQRVEQQFTVNFNLGGEYYFFKGSIPLRLGFFSNYSSAKKLLDSKYVSQRKDDYGISFSLGHETKNSTVNVGFLTTIGNGQARDTDDGIVDFSIQTYSVFLAGSYRF